jgi:hypothetical protein
MSGLSVNQFAAGGGPPDGRCIVALPAADQKVHDLGSEPVKHMTLVWLGAPEENPDLDMGMVEQQVASAAGDLAPFSADVNRVDTLGDEGASVWMLDPNSGVDVRDRLLSEPQIKAGHEAVKQYPSFTPHATIGYDGAPPEAAQVDRITFDRLGVWNGDDKTEHPLGQEEQMTTTIDEATAPDEAMPMTAVPWHGVLAPEGVWSGDGRQFREGALSMGDLPLPLTWQKASGEGHAGSVVVAKIEQAAMVGNEMRACGHFLMNPEADEAIGLVGEFGRFGVSVDADSAEFEFDDESGRVAFDSARIRSAAMVPIPAFAEAFVALGDAPDGFLPDECDPTDPEGECYDPSAVQAAIEFVSDKPWSGFTQSDYSPAQWKSACVMHLAPEPVPMSNHKLPIKEPGGALNKNGVHAAAARFNQTQGPADAKAAAKAALRGAYSQIGEEPPDVLKASTTAFDRGPGWITNPVATKRIHDYWTVPGNEGYAKIGWGTDGDFDRCRVEIGQEIAEQDPTTVARFMNQICAQWHHDATGFWPGHAPAERSHASEGIALSDTDQAAPALRLVASTGWCAPSEWFKNPEFDHPTPMTITDEGRVFGHLAEWSTCHVGFEGICVSPPHSASGYAYFLTGYVQTDDGPVATGPISLGGGHARDGLSMRGAIAHYDSTSTAVCDITVGEDDFGIWTAGWVRPGVSQEQVVAVRASAPSGDWREVAPGQMEMIAALSVNAPGFVVPRVGVRNGVQVSLVAAGVVARPERVMDEIVDRVMEELDARMARRTMMATLAKRVWASDGRAERKAKMAELAARARGGQ